MPTPTGGNWRNTFVGPKLSRMHCDLQILACAVEAREGDSYDATHFGDLTDALDAAIVAVGNAEYANEHASDPS